MSVWFLNVSEEVEQLDKIRFQVFSCLLFLSCIAMNDQLDVYNSLQFLVSRISEIFKWVHFIWKSIIIASLRKCFCKQVRRNILWSLEVWQWFLFATGMEGTSSQDRPGSNFYAPFLHCYFSNYSIVFSYLLVRNPLTENSLKEKLPFVFVAPGSWSR